MADIAVCNAAGALHHLTFMDEAKIEVMQWLRDADDSALILVRHVSMVTH